MRFEDKLREEWHNIYKPYDKYYIEVTCVDDIEKKYVVEAGRIFNSHLNKEGITLELYAHQVCNIEGLAERLLQAVYNLESFSDIVC